MFLVSLEVFFLPGNNYLLLLIIIIISSFILQVVFFITYADKSVQDLGCSKIKIHAQVLLAQKLKTNTVAFHGRRHTIIQ